MQGKKFGWISLLNSILNKTYQSDGKELEHAFSQILKQIVRVSAISMKTNFIEQVMTTTLQEQEYIQIQENLVNENSPK